MTCKKNNNFIKKYQHRFRFNLSIINNFVVVEDAIFSAVTKTIITIPFYFYRSPWVI